MENRRILLARCFFAAALISLCIPFDSIDIFLVAANNEESVDVHYFWMNSIIYGGIYGRYFINILSVLPFSACFCQEYHQGIWRYIIARSGTKKYVIHNFFRAFIYGGLTAAAGGLLIILFLNQSLSLFLSNRYIEVTFLPFSELLLDYPGQYFLIMLYLLFLTGGLWSCVSYCFSAYMPTRYMIYLISFVASFLLTRVNTMLQVPDEWRIDFWMRGRAGPDNPVLYLILLTTAIFLIVCFCCWMFYRKIEWRIANE